MDGNEERDCATFDRLLTVLIAELSIQDGKTTEEPSQRSSTREFQLVILRLFRFVILKFSPFFKLAYAKVLQKCYFLSLDIKPTQDSKTFVKSYWYQPLTLRSLIQGEALIKG